MLIKLAVLGVIIATVAVFMLIGVDLKALLDQGIEIIRGAGPVLFFTALAVLPAVGCPLTFFTLPAGSVFAPELGMPLVLLLVCVSIAVNLAITYWLSRHLFRPWLIKLLVWLGYKLPKVAAKNHRGRPQVADQISADVACQHDGRDRKSQQREKHIILEGLTPALPEKILQERKL